MPKLIWKIKETLKQSECDLKFALITFSGLCAPGPGFMCVSDGILNLDAIEKIGDFFKTKSSLLSYAPGPGT